MTLRTLLPIAALSGFVLTACAAIPPPCSAGDANACYAQGLALAGDGEPRRDADARANAAAEAFARACESKHREACRKAILFFASERPVTQVDAMTGIGVASAGGRPHADGRARAEKLFVVLEGLEYESAMATKRLDAVEAFLTAFPCGPSTVAARRRIAELELAPVEVIARAKWDLSPLLDFAVKYPQYGLEQRLLAEIGAKEQPMDVVKRAPEALRGRLTWLRDEKNRAGDIAKKAELDAAEAEVVAFLANARRREEDVSFEAAVARSEAGIKSGMLEEALSPYVNYRKWYPKSSHENDATAREAAAALQFVKKDVEGKKIPPENVPKAYADVRKAYPSAPAAQEANKLGARAAWALARASTSLGPAWELIEDYPAEQPDAARALLAQLLLGRSREVDSDDCEKFLTTFPSAPEAAAVKRRMAQLKEREAASARQREAQERAEQAREQASRSSASSTSGSSRPYCTTGTGGTLCCAKSGGGQCTILLVSRGIGLDNAASMCNCEVR